MTSVEHALIEIRPSLVGPRAVVRGTNILVWVLIEYLRVYDGDIDRVAESYPSAGRAGVEAALAYYESHREEIDANIAANAEAEALLTAHPELGEPQTPR